MNVPFTPITKNDDGTLTIDHLVGSVVGDYIEWAFTRDGKRFVLMTLHVSCVKSNAGRDIVNESVRQLMLESVRYIAEKSGVKIGGVIMYPVGEVKL